MIEAQFPPSRRLRALVRVDFIAAVALTVLAPLALLAGALRWRRAAELGALLGYWRTSSLLHATVYLLIGERRGAFASGLAARLAIAWTLAAGAARPTATSSAAYRRWARLAAGYSLLGALASLPLLRGTWQTPLPPACRAYIEPAQQFGALLHPGVSRASLGRVGLLGASGFWLGALLVALRRATRAM